MNPYQNLLDAEEPECDPADVRSGVAVPFGHRFMGDWKVVGGAGWLGDADAYWERRERHAAIVARRRG
jgi:hypothetical protein